MGSFILVTDRLSGHRVVVLCLDLDFGTDDVCRMQGGCVFVTDRVGQDRGP